MADPRMGDYDGDRKADILWRHQTGGGVVLWRMDGTAVRDRTYLATVDPAFDIVGPATSTATARPMSLAAHLHR